MLPTLTVRRYGWNRPHYDPSKPMAVRVMPHLFKAQALPRKFSLRSQMFNPYDQSDIGSCTGNGLARILAFLRVLAGKLTIQQANTPAGTPSRLMIYYNEREREGTTSTDSGAAVHDGIHALNKQGACMENIWPYDTSKFAVKPPSQAYRMGLSDLLVTYAAIDTADQSSKKLAIINKRPVVFGFTCYPELESAQAARTGQVALPSGTEQPIGGHCVVKTGWDDDMVIDGHKGAYEWCNSWSGSWGDAGYGWAPYDYFDNPQLADDMWIGETTN